jgi:hypothetical protein
MFFMLIKNSYLLAIPNVVARRALALSDTIPNALIGTKQSPVIRRLLTALPKEHRDDVAYGAHLPWRAVPGSVG